MNLALSNEIENKILLIRGRYRKHIPTDPKSFFGIYILFPLLIFMIITQCIIGVVLAVSSFLDRKYYRYLLLPVVYFAILLISMNVTKNSSSYSLSLLFAILGCAIYYFLKDFTDKLRSSSSGSDQKIISYVKVILIGFLGYGILVWINSESWGKKLQPEWTLGLLNQNLLIPNKESIVVKEKDSNITIYETNATHSSYLLALPISDKHKWYFEKDKENNSVTISVLEKDGNETKLSFGQKRYNIAQDK